MDDPKDDLESGAPKPGDGPKVEPKNKPGGGGGGPGGTPLDPILGGPYTPRKQGEDKPDPEGSKPKLDKKNPDKN